MLAARVSALLVALFLIGIADAEAKGRGRGNGNVLRAQGNGPAFCRSGAGHPVHGWAWCQQKGWDRIDRRAVTDREVIVDRLPDGRVAIPRRTPREQDRDRDDGGWFPWPF